MTRFDAACTEFVELELRLCATFNREDTAEEEDAREVERSAIYALQYALLDGIRAKARTLVAWDEEAIPKDTSLTAAAIRASLLRDLVDADDPVMWEGRATA